MKKLTSNLTLLLTPVVIATGCSSSDDSTVPPIPLDTSVIRAYQQGDTISATFTLTNTATGLTATGKGTFTIGDTVKNPYGIDCRVAITSGTVTGSAGTLDFSGRSLFYQDGNNSMYNCGDYDTASGKYIFIDDTTATPNGVYLELESPIQVGNTTAGVSTFSDGSWEDCTSTVEAIENVPIPLGLFESYRVQEACSYSDGTVSEETLWWVPAISDIKSSATEDSIRFEGQLTGYSW